MNNYWGNLVLKITNTKIDDPINVSEKSLLPDPTQIGSNTVLTASGIGREKVEITGRATILNYNSLKSDLTSYAQRALTIYLDGVLMVNATYMLTALSGVGNMNTGFMDYSASFVKVGE